MQVTTWLTDDEQRLWRDYCSLREDLETVTERQLTAAAGLTNSDYAVLAALSDKPPSLRTSALAEEVRWDLSRTSHQLRRMESRGLVARRPSSEDGRGTDVFMTALGRDSLDAAAPGHVQTVREFFIDVMSADEKIVVAQVLSRIARVNRRMLWE